jgi:phosphatidylserine/phosphatidylglycerophosphate/cardiolipin synthase-like enzyme
MNLKLLGTHEKFLVCDRTFAMIGSHNFLTSNCHSTEREIGLKTNDKNIIENLIRRFETAPCLDKAEAIA